MVGAESPFDRYADRYDRWFDDHPAVYRAELRAVRALWPEGAEGVEIGVGTGRFAAPLGIRHGVEPSEAMRRLARARGIDAVDGVAERLPYADASFDAVLMVTVLCFLRDPQAALQECRRVLRPGGTLLIGFIDRDSPLGASYLRQRRDHPLHRHARPLAARDVLDPLAQAGFAEFAIRQTLLRPPAEVRDDEPVVEGHGRGLFVVIRGAKPA